MCLCLCLCVCVCVCVCDCVCAYVCLFAKSGWESWKTGIVWYFGIVVFCVLCGIVVLWYCVVLFAKEWLESWKTGIVCLYLYLYVFKEWLGEMEDRYCAPTKPELGKWMSKRICSCNFSN